MLSNCELKKERGRGREKRELTKACSYAAGLCVS